MLICLTGTGGTGKSTLAKALAEKIGYDYREVPTRKVPSEIRGNTDEGQKLAYQYYGEFFDSLINDTVSTRSKIDVMGYSKAYGVWDDDYIDELVAEYRKSDSFPDLIIYLPIQFDLQSDGDREKFIDKWYEVDEAIREIMNRNNIPYFLVSGTVEERVNQVLNILKRE